MWDLGEDKLTGGHKGVKHSVGRVKWCEGRDGLRGPLGLDREGGVEHC